MNQHHLVPLVIAFCIAGCGQRTEEVATRNELVKDSATEVEIDATNSIEHVEPVCPTADDDGRIDIAEGLTATILEEGDGRTAAAGDYADVHTTLWLHDESADGGRGIEIWSSGGVKPFQFQLGAGQVIKGWDMGVPCMHIGETRELVIAGELGYGVAGRGQIPPNAALLFNIELLRLTAAEH